MTQQVASHARAKGTQKIHPIPDKVLKSLAQSVFETLCNEGCQAKDIIGVSSQLISLVTYELARQHES